MAQIREPLKYIASSGLASKTAEGKEWEARFLLMSEAYTQQTQGIGNCNQQREGLRQWYERQGELEVVP